MCAVLKRPQQLAREDPIDKFDASTKTQKGFQASRGFNTQKAYERKTGSKCSLAVSATLLHLTVHSCSTVCLCSIVKHEFPTNGRPSVFGTNFLVGHDDPAGDQWNLGCISGEAMFSSQDPLLGFCKVSEVRNLSTLVCVD